MLQTSDRCRERLATTGSVSRALARSLDATDILRSVYKEMARALDVTICFFGIHDRSSHSVEVIWQVHNGVELPGGRFPLGSGPTSRAIHECQTQLIREWSSSGPPVQVQYATDHAGLPESSIIAPVVFDGQVLAILAIQSYEPEAYDADDAAMVQVIAYEVAVALGPMFRPHKMGGGFDGGAGAMDAEAVLASMPDALLVIDAEGRLVRLNAAARELLAADDRSLILGHPVDRQAADQWPLGSRALTEQLRPIVDKLKRGDSPNDEVTVSLDGAPGRTLICRASVVMKDGAPGGGLLVLRRR